jgi:hypothetical protein
MKRTKVRSVRHVLSGDACFRTESFARGYSWGAPEISQLLIELEDSARDGLIASARRSLYLGVVSITPCPKGPDVFLLDGLQRVVSLSMFLAFARAVPRIQLLGEEQDFFVRQILTPGATLRMPEAASEAGVRNLLSSARFMHRAFRDYSIDFIRTLVGALLDHAAVVVAIGEPRIPGPVRVNPARLLATPSAKPTASGVLPAPEIVRRPAEPVSIPRPEPGPARAPSISYARISPDSLDDHSQHDGAI